MTLSEIMKSEKVVLTPADVAEVLGCDPAAIRSMARYHPENLGFPVSVLGRNEDLSGARTVIPRIPFLHFLLGRGEKDG